ncbi:Mac1 protein [Maudiozyma humilis]|uniref:Mac1 protein n=1 Tax=Maudiozyma humilis TaxID=51915 RepID=A0AAV5S341_MAUHU|nr:Mac1 protein [Kazachstania humilis]
MIIYNGAKYACASCIRGHRSSTCRHTKRMLVKVRTRGRPAPLDIRDVIVVDADSQVKNKLLQESFEQGQPEAQPGGNSTAATSPAGRSPSPGAPGCAMRNAQPVLFVRARQTKKAMLVDGKLSIIMDGAANGSDSAANASSAGVDPAGSTTMSEREFLRSQGARPAVKREAPANDSACGPVCNTPMRGAPGAKRKCCDPHHVPGTVGTPQSESHLPPVQESQTDLLSDALANPLANPLDTMVSPGSGSVGSVGSASGTSGTSASAVPDIFDTVDIFTHKGIYLSADCSCPDDSCQCINCLIHRNEDELSQYIQSTGVPLTSLRGSLGETSPKDSLAVPCSNAACECTLADCACADCYVHPTEIIPFERFYYHGVLNTRLRRKTIVRYNNKLVPSEYWWEFLTVQVPAMQDAQLEALDLRDWFDKLLKSHAHELLDAHTEEFPFNDLEGFYVI